MKRTLTLAPLLFIALATQALAKLPPLGDEAKAKAAEAAAKTAHGNKVADFQLCKSMDRVAASYAANAKKAGTAAKPATATPPCADPGAFVYAPAAPATPVAPTVAGAAPAAPAAATAPVASAAPAVATAAAPKK